MTSGLRLRHLLSCSTQAGSKCRSRTAGSASTVGTDPADTPSVKERVVRLARRATQPFLWYNGSMNDDIMLVPIAPNVPTSEDATGSFASERLRFWRVEIDRILGRDLPVIEW